MRRLIIGCGYLGSRVAPRWREAGDDVLVVTRSDQRAAAFQQQGLRPVVADVTSPATLAELPVADTVLYAVGFDRGAGLSMREVYVDGLRHVLDALPAATGRIIYVSSTGVYGQSDGAWLDEDSPTQPERESGQVCLAAEELLESHRLGDRAVVLRLAGIYGPDRVPNSAALLAGEPIDSPEEGYLNLIHVDDAATVVLAAAAHPQPSPRYVVSDGHPVLRRDYYAEAARLLGAPAPRFRSPPSGSPKLARGLQQTPQQSQVSERTGAGLRLSHLSRRSRGYLT